MSDYAALALKQRTSIGFWPFSSSSDVTYVPDQYTPVSGPGGRPLTQIEEQFTRAYQDFNNLYNAWKAKNPKWVGIIQPIVDLRDKFKQDYSDAVALYESGGDPDEKVAAVMAKYMNVLRNFARKSLLDMDNKVQDFSAEIKRQAYVASLDQLDKDLGRPVEQAGKLAKGAADAGQAAEGALTTLLSWLPWIGVGVVSVVVLPYAVPGIVRAVKSLRSAS